MSNVILQAVSQPAAHRLMLYASSPHLQAFPPDQRFCESAHEVGLGASEHEGPGLVLLMNCHLDPKEFVKHVTGSFLRGYNEQELLESSRGLHNAFSATTLLDGRSRSCTTATTTTQVEHKVVALSNVKIRLQTFPRELATKLIDSIPELDGAMHQFSHSLYVVESDGVIRYGLGKGEDMYLVACDREALFKGYVARACSKLEEMLQVKGIKLRQDMLVLDVGAAPGAWTEFLCKTVSHVVAIDPGKLSSNIIGGRVTHIRKKAQDALVDLRLWTGGRSFDLLVCDINKHPAEAAEVVLPLLQFLSSGCHVILTLKFHGRGKNKDDKVSELKAIFGDSLTMMESIWLLANSIYERTFVGVKR